ncbi:hypothetical protein [Sphingobacterium sp.]|uniref:hypothetical protein n=1 Tax=Sphingobacterium sp. TaxID=341027 RepID=UPI00258858D4|nr:hypothetical protein [Sphingobacterium sp.]WET69099.1 MAG: hypothetical protein P0Y57_24975 [Sphingobacterium sp.]
MSKFPFTTEGVQDKLVELYALSDEDLNLQADKIEVLFKDWMDENFILSTAQQSFMSNMKEEVLNYYSSQCALCFRHRLMITLNYPLPPAPGYAKWPESSNTIKVSGDDLGNSIFSGTLTFTMIYK